MPINEALPRRTKMSLKELDDQFAQLRAGAGRTTVARGRPGKSPDLPGRRRLRGARRPGWRSIPRASPAGAGSRPGWSRRGSSDRAKGAIETLKATVSGICRAGERLHAAGRPVPQAVRPGRRAQGARGAGGARRQRQPGLPAAAGAGGGGRRLAGRGPRRPAAAGRQPPDPGPVPPARQRLRTSSATRRGADRLPRRRRARRLRPRRASITAWPGSSSSRASATRPAARSSSRSRRPRGSSTPTGSCSSWSNPPGQPTARRPRRRPEGHDP